VLLDGAQDLVHAVPHHLGAGLGVRLALEVLDEPVEDFPPVVEARHLASAELNRRLDLVPLFEEPDDVPELEVVVVLVDVRPELDFLDLGDLLLPLGLVLFLLLLERELPVVHDLADRRVGLLGDHDDVEAFLAALRERRLRLEDAELLARGRNQPDTLETQDVLVDRGVLGRGDPGTTSEECDGDFLLLLASR